MIVKTTVSKRQAFRTLNPLSSLFLLCACVACLYSVNLGAASYHPGGPAKYSNYQRLEILWITGCTRPVLTERGRQTISCFSDLNSFHPVQLTVRGRGFPQLGNLSIVLEEHTPIPHHGGEEDLDLISMPCLHVRPSSLFPRQILSCTLLNPMDSLRHKPLWLERLTTRSTWMNLKLLQTVTSDNSNKTTTVTLASVPRAVELDLTPYGNGSHSGGEEDEEEDAEDPLEYMFRRVRHSAMNDEWVSLGIGGLSEQLHELFRRVFLSRTRQLRGVVESLNIPPVRGVLLHGPPGTGKTLIARMIAKLEGKGTRVTIVNAADIISKYVGDSEKNLRRLFDANNMWGDDDDEDEHGGTRHASGADEETANSKRLHIVIMDELDALFKRRADLGEESSTKAVYDGLTNQFLTIMDGVNKARNILIIGLTNRLHAIDRALLRPGRFEVVIEVPLPDVKGRREMFFIHTRELRDKDFLAEDVSLDILAERTGGFSGADVAGTVRAAVSHALLRFRDSSLNTSFPTGDIGIEDELSGAATEHFKVTSSDFQLALRDVWDSKAQVNGGQDLAGDGKGLDSAVDKLVDFDGTISRGMGVVRRLMRSIQHSQITNAAVVVIHGSSGSGKTVFARNVVSSIRFSMTKFLTGRELSGRAARDIQEVIDALRDAGAFKGDYCLVVDNVERYVRSGDSGAADALRSAINEFKSVSSSGLFPHSEWDVSQPRRKRLLIITTAEEEVLQGALGSVEYDVRLNLQPIRREGVLKLLHHYGILPQTAKLPNEVVRAYPTSLTYRQFLRITDLALWRAHEEHHRTAETTSTGEAESMETSLYSSLNELFTKGGPQRSGGDHHSPPVLTESQQAELAAAIRDVASEMGISDAFDGVLNADGSIHGEEMY